jgi:hypothetical protein
MHDVVRIEVGGKQVMPVINDLPAGYPRGGNLPPGIGEIPEDTHSDAVSDSALMLAQDCKAAAMRASLSGLKSECDGEVEIERDGDYIVTHWPRVTTRSHFDADADDMARFAREQFDLFAVRLSQSEQHERARDRAAALVGAASGIEYMSKPLGSERVGRKGEG